MQIERFKEDFLFRKLSFLSLRSLQFPPSPTQRSSPNQEQPQMLEKSYSSSPRQRRKKRRFFKKPSFFNKIEDKEHKEHTPEKTLEPSFLGQIYKETKFKLSRSLQSESSSSSQVNMVHMLADHRNYKSFHAMHCFNILTLIGSYIQNTEIMICISKTLACM